MKEYKKERLPKRRSLIKHDKIEQILARKRRKKKGFITKSPLNLGWLRGRCNYKKRIVRVTLIRGRKLYITTIIAFGTLLQSTSAPSFKPPTLEETLATESLTDPGTHQPTLHNHPKCSQTTLTSPFTKNIIPRPHQIRHFPRHLVEGIHPIMENLPDKKLQLLGNFHPPHYDQNWLVQGLRVNKTKEKEQLEKPLEELGHQERTSPFQTKHINYPNNSTVSLIDNEGRNPKEGAG